MTSGQWTVLTLLLVTGGIELLFSPLSGTLAYSLITGKSVGNGTSTNVNQPVIEQLAAPGIAAIGFVLGVLLLLWLASAVPQLAVVIAWAILILVVLRYGSQIVSVSSNTPTAKKGTG